MFLKNRSKNADRKALARFSDEELIARYKQNRDPHCLEELFGRYTHLLFGVCMKHLKDIDESKDAVMVIFEDLPRKLVDFEIASFKSWIYMVSRNHCLMQLRKEKAVRNHQREIYENSRQQLVEMPAFYHHNESEEKEKQLTLLQKGLILLKEEQKRCIELLYLQKKSYREVSEITGYDMKKVKSHIQNGKRNLRIFLEEK